MIYLYIIASACLCGGGYYVFLALLRFPPSAPGKVADRYSRKVKQTSTLEKKFVLPLARRLAPFMCADTYKEMRLCHKLRRLDISLSAKEYTARIWVITAYSLIPFVLTLILGAPLIALLCIVLTVLVFFFLNGRVDDLLKRRGRNIMFELPRFIRTFIFGMEAQKDPIVLLEKYRKVSGDALGKDIDILISDMKTGNQEQALRKFDEAVDIPQMTNFVTALISQMRGDDQHATFQHLAGDMSLLAAENMKRLLALRPGRVKAASIPMVVMIIVIYVYAIAANLLSGIGVLFQ